MPRADRIRGALPTFSAVADWIGDRVRTAFNRGRDLGLGAIAFAGAQVNRLTADWILSPLTSADQEIRADLRTLRRRSREICRNVSYATRFLGLLEENVVGPKGIRFQSRVIDPVTGKQDKVSNQRIEDAFKRWARPENASVDGRLSWRGIQELAIRTVAQDGECFIRMVEGYENSFGFALQFIDADQVDITFDRAARDGENEVRMGVEIDRWGRPVAYHAWKHHPQDYHTVRDQARERIPAAEVIHLYAHRRVGQTRGVPWLAPVLMDVRMLAGLQEAELVASRISAAKMGWFVPEDETAPDPNTIRGRKRRTKMSAEPGLFDFIPDGAKDFKPWDPQHPNSAFGDFSRTILRSIATGVRSSYSSLSGDLTQVSYSSIRDGTIKERDVYAMLHWWLVEHMHERVQSRWRVWAVTTRQLELDPSRRLRDFDAHEFIPRGFEWVDPLKEVLALKESFDLLIDSRTRAASSRGRDFEEIVADRVRELETVAAAGLEEEPAAGTETRFTLAGEEDEDVLVSAYLSERLQEALRASATRNGHEPHSES